MYRIINKLIDYKDELLNLKTEKIRIEFMLCQKEVNMKSAKSKLTNNNKEDIMYDKSERKKLQIMLSDNEKNICNLK